MIAIGQPSFKRVHIYIQTGNTWSRLLTLNGDSDYGSFIRHTVSETGTYTMVVGGYGETLYSGTLSWEVLT